MKFLGGNHLWEEKTANRDEIPGRKYSMAGNHPCEKNPANQDEIRGWKSSLGEETNKSG